MPDHKNTPSFRKPKPSEQEANSNAIITKKHREELKMPDFFHLRNIDSMICFLKEKGLNHKKYYHYTSWDSMKKIFQNKSFLLTRGNSLTINDQHEALMKGSWDEWNKIFIGSFSFGSSENMAMWGLYGMPWADGVRIAIPKDAMRWWIKSIQHINLFRNGQVFDYQDGFDVGLNDIVYVSGRVGVDRPQLTHYGISFTVSDTYPLWGIDTAKAMTGYIKNYAWQYENEVRLRIRLVQDTGYERISVPIPDGVIDSITVTTGPSFEERNDVLYEKLKKAGRIEESGFKHLVNFKDMCRMCQHNFVKKED